MSDNEEEFDHGQPPPAAEFDDEEEFNDEEGFDFDEWMHTEVYRNSDDKRTIS
jgi:hypothetical protein